MMRTAAIIGESWAGGKLGGGCHKTVIFIEGILGVDTHEMR